VLTYKNKEKKCDFEGIVQCKDGFLAAISVARLTPTTYKTRVIKISPELFVESYENK